MVWGIADWLVSLRTGKPGSRSWLCHLQVMRPPARGLTSLSKSTMNVVHCTLPQGAGGDHSARTLLSKLHPPPRAAGPSERAFPKWSSSGGETFSFTKVKQLLFTKQVCPWRECVLLL